MQNESTKCPLCDAEAVVPFMTAPDRFHWRTETYNLLRCQSCQCVWLLEPPRPEKMHIHYSEHYHRTIMAGGEKSAGTRWKKQRELILRTKAGGAILDIGCSSGGFLGTMGRGWKLYGIEMEPTAAERARKSTGAEVYVGNATDAPFNPESFDVITCFDVLEHVYDPRHFLTKVQEWLKPGGVFCTGLPNISSWEARLLGTYWYGLELPRHLFHFSPESLRRTMDSLGFEEVSLRTPANSYIERSMSYLYSSMLEKIGKAPISMAERTDYTVMSRIFRKAVRLGLIAPIGKLASIAGAGASIEGIFSKTQ